MRHFFTHICLFISLFGLYPNALHTAEPNFTIIIPSYNNERWCIGNLESVASQTYPHFSVIYINDCSSDKTGELVDDFVKTRNLQNKFTVIHNKERKGAPLPNIHAVISTLAPDTIVVIVDGDDRLAHPHVLDRVAKEYRNPNVWMTYGNYTTHPIVHPSCCKKIPSKIAKKGAFRSFQWASSHLRTHYAKLFQLIKKEDLFWNGAFYPMAGDVASMFPMLEMSAKGHFRFIEDVLYIYNIANPINESRLNLKLQYDLDLHIRKQRPYAALNRLF
ncbi:MAG TPA: glycosyltransferase family A protein [Chlamydiales bacterium]|nr:glycosyltransferase family A protein [Chlamydiales bacterium]